MSDLICLREFSPSLREMNSHYFRAIHEGSNVHPLVLEKVKLLLARERELHSVRQEYQRYKQWQNRVLKITTSLSELESRRSALNELVQQLVADSSYEFAAAVYKGELFYFGVTPDAGDRAVMGELSRWVVENASLKIVTDGSRQICWLMAGPVVSPGSRSDVKVALFVGRTRRTTGFFPPPWDEERSLFEQLLPTVAHVFMAVEFRSKLAAEREALKDRVAEATSRLKNANEELAQRTEQLRETNALLVKELDDRALTERTRAELQEEMIRVQRARLDEMSTPLIPITNQMVVMPLIGTVDSERAQQVVEAALEGAQRHRAKVIILDVTGMKHIDVDVAGAFVRAASALRMLGARTVLTGIRAEIAHTLVSLGVDLSSLKPRSTLQSGIAYAMTLTGA